MDSGASQHVTSYKTDFVSYREYSSPREFRTAQEGEGGVVHGLGEGTVRGIIEVDGVRKTIELKNVCYVPKAGVRLFSTGTIEKYGYYMF